MSKQTIIARLKKTIEVLESPHLKEVEVAYRGTDEHDVRIYDVTTHCGQHLYTVRVQDWTDDSGELQKWTRCNCIAGAKGLVCRHVLRVAEADSEMLERDLWTETFQSYRAHLRSK